MTTAVTGHCSQCHKVWTLKTRQGVCQWCGKQAVCQNQTTQALRSIKSNPKRRKRQAPVSGNGYNPLDGKWLTYYEVASRFNHKAKAQDRGDLLHDIIVSLAEAQMRLDNNGGGQLSDVAMLRIASYECKKYWRAEYRNGKVISLNTIIADDDGNQIELIDTLADDKAIDLEAWIDHSTWQQGFPDRLAQIARKRLYGIPLNGNEQRYWHRYRQKEQKRLL